MPLILGALGALLMQMLRQYLPGILGRVLLAFGIGFVTHKLAMPALKAFIETKVSGLPALVVAYWGATGLSVATTMLLSCWLAVIAQKAFLAKLGS